MLNQYIFYQITRFLFPYHIYMYLRLWIRPLSLFWGTVSSNTLSFASPHETVPMYIPLYMHTVLKCCVFVVIVWTIPSLAPGRSYPLPGTLSRLKYVYLTTEKAQKLRHVCIVFGLYWGMEVSKNGLFCCKKLLPTLPSAMSSPSWWRDWFCTLLQKSLFLVLFYRWAYLPISDQKVVKTSWHWHIFGITGPGDSGFHAFSCYKVIIYLSSIKCILRVSNIYYLSACKNNTSEDAIIREYSASLDGRNLWANYSRYETNQSLYGDSLCTFDIKLWKRTDNLILWVGESLQLLFPDGYAPLTYVHWFMLVRILSLLPKCLICLIACERNVSWILSIHPRQVLCTYCSHNRILHEFHCRVQFCGLIA